MVTLKFNIELCKSCGLCVRACPKEVLKIGEQYNKSGDRYVTAANPEACIGCASCAISCPDRVIRIYKEEA